MWFSPDQYASFVEHPFFSEGSITQLTSIRAIANPCVRLSLPAFSSVRNPKLRNSLTPLSSCTRWLVSTPTFKRCQRSEPWRSGRLEQTHLSSYRERREGSSADDDDVSPASLGTAAASRGGGRPSRFNRFAGCRARQDGERQRATLQTSTAAAIE